jgi:serine/threonine protein kinase
MVYLHGRAIIHGDLKAPNVLLKSGSSEPSRSLTAKVADFGLSQPLVPGQGSLGSSCQGTLSHMAPEVLVHGQVGACRLTRTHLCRHTDDEGGRMAYGRTVLTG